MNKTNKKKNPTWDIDVCCAFFLSGKGLGDELIIRPEESNRCVWSRNLVNEAAMAHGGLLRQYKKKWGPCFGWVLEIVSL